MNHSRPASPSDRPTKLVKMDNTASLPDVVTATEPIPSYRPDAKARRYDRQLRLWASSGQRSLESARVLLVGCDATGCQALKNLVLPGISHFTILSPATTTPKDVATNFFLHPDSIGSSIAQEAVKYLKELNPAVEGEARQDALTDILTSDSGYLLSFSLIIASNLEPALELQLADLLWRTSADVGGPDIPLVPIRTSGFIGRVEIQAREHCVVDTHPDTTHTLRIDQPFPALEQYARSLDLDSMDSMEYSHVPWVVLLVRALLLWKNSHGGNLPRTDLDDDNHPDGKEAFKASIRAMKRKGDEENFDEALAQAYRATQQSEISSDLRELLKDDSVTGVTSNSKNIHILLAALNLYLQSNALPPISPTLPDMHSSTSSYITLQNLYKAQFQTDLELYRKHLTIVLQGLGLPEDAVPSEEVESFVRNTGGVAVIKSTALRERKDIKGAIAEQVSDNFGLDDYLSPNSFALHLALLASERYHSTYKRWPGTTDIEDMASENAKLEEILREMVSPVRPKETSLPETVAECIAEVARGGFGNLPTTAAFIGGIVAQEAIKLVTNQYTPLDNTCVVDLVRSSLQKWKF